MRKNLSPDFYPPPIIDEYYRNLSRCNDASDNSNNQLLNEALKRVPLLNLEPSADNLPENSKNSHSLPAMNYFRYWQTSFGDYFLSVDTGEWALLSSNEFKSLLAVPIETELLTKLKKNNIWLTDENIQKYERRLRVKYGFLTEGPTLHIIVVTSNCNLKCVYCQASAPTSPKIDMDKTTAKLVVDRIFESPSDSYIIEFQGGEPMLNFPIVKFIIEYAEKLSAEGKKRIEFNLISNFTRVVTEKKLRFLIEHNVSICFSLDGPKNLHEGNRGKDYPFAFDILLEILELYKNVWMSLKKEPVPLAALMTTTKATLPMYKSIIDQYVKLGFTKISLRQLTPLGNALENFSNISYSAEEFFSFWKSSIEYILDLRSQGVDILDFYLELILTKLFGNESGFMDLRSPCGASYGQIAYNYDGSIFSCDEGRMINNDDFKIGENSNIHLNNRLSSPQAIAVLNYSIAEQYHCDYCAFKPYCGVCPVLHKQQKGRMNINVLESDHCKIFKKMFAFIIEKYVYDENARDHFNNILLNIEWQKQ
jgi:His-Xaa-Ser system radical SAM maturase HxsB